MFVEHMISTAFAFASENAWRIRSRAVSIATTCTDWLQGSRTGDRRVYYLIGCCASVILFVFGLLSWYVSWVSAKLTQRGNDLALKQLCASSTLGAEDQRFCDQHHDHLLLENVAHWMSSGALATKILPSFKVPTGVFCGSWTVFDENKDVCIGLLALILGLSLRNAPLLPRQSIISLLRTYLLPAATMFYAALPDSCRLALCVTVAFNNPGRLTRYRERGQKPSLLEDFRRAALVLRRVFNRCYKADQPKLRNVKLVEELRSVLSGLIPLVIGDAVAKRSDPTLLQTLFVDLMILIVEVVVILATFGDDGVPDKWLPGVADRYDGPAGDAALYRLLHRYIRAELSLRQAKQLADAVVPDRELLEPAGRYISPKGDAALYRLLQRYMVLLRRATQESERFPQTNTPGLRRHGLRLEPGEERNLDGCAFVLVVMLRARQLERKTRAGGTHSSQSSVTPSGP